MKRTILVLTAVAVLGGLTATGQAAVQSFFSPLDDDGARLRFCLPGGKVCGKPVADAWCQDRSYQKALLFQRETRKTDCFGSACIIFRRINCWGPGDGR